MFEDEDLMLEDGLMIDDMFDKDEDDDELENFGYNPDDNDDFDLLDE